MSPTTSDIERAEEERRAAQIRKDNGWAGGIAALIISIILFLLFQWR